MARSLSRSPLLSHRFVCFDFVDEFVVVEIESRPPEGSALYSAATVTAVGDETVDLMLRKAGEETAVSVSRLLVPMSTPASSQSGFCCTRRGMQAQRMRSVVITASDDGLTVRDKREHVPIEELAAMRTLSDARLGSEALCKNGSGAYIPSVVSAVEADGACTALKKSGEKQSVAFMRLLSPADPEKLQDGVQVLWSADASCESFRPAVIDSPNVGLEDLAVPATRDLVEVGGRAFYRQEEDDSERIYSVATITAASAETVDLHVEVAQNVKLDRLKPLLLPLDREAIAVETKVQYQYHEGGTSFYPATVKVVRDDGTFDIVEDDNEKHDSVDISRLFFQGEALDQASLQKGSKVRYGDAWEVVVTEVKEDGECAANLDQSRFSELPNVCRYVRPRR